MARSYYFIIKLFLLLNAVSVNIVARPINVPKSVDYADGVIRGAMNIFSLAAIKSAGRGPSAGGKRHEFPTCDSFGTINNSGPSPGGKGHEFTDGKILGEIKNSGPSAGGKGHGFSDNAESFGNIKSSGPSARGKGHDLPSSVKTLGNILKSGPSRGVKGHGFRMDNSLVETTSSGKRSEHKGQVVTISGNLLDIKNSGPSPGGKGH
ncbi:hypothetical protein L6452_06424 [Arctium lappa]|uniref:Uncharacterized protein n=1 Tax=Arctium lappa TaxID=4217 RepID=A0ACB9EJ50_ARCLA|nr:hypothetical protein L6452_06424 [Arctium lappa]